MSEVGQALRRRSYAEARRLAGHWRTVLPVGSLAMEIVSHLSAPGENLSTAHAVRMLNLAGEMKIPAVLTNAVRYCEEDGAATADVLDSARALTALSKLPDLQPSAQGWLKSPAQMQALAREIVQAAGGGSRDVHRLLSMTEAVADRCRMDPYRDMGFKHPVVPEASVIGIDGEPMTELLQRWGHPVDTDLLAS
jgi:error-prone DNA polymerase